jgi:hypothetical protein
VDIQVSPAILARIEALPGFYSNGTDITTRDFNVPSKLRPPILSVQISFCWPAFTDVNADTPVFPVIGVHCAFDNG